MADPDIASPTPNSFDGDAVAAEEPLSSGLNPFAPGFYDDPYAQYRQLRETEPVHHSPLGLWFLSRWADCHQVLRLPGTSVDERNSVIQERNDALEEAAGGRGVRRTQSILGTDPPDHTRIRKLVSKAFTPRTISRLEGRVAEVADERLDAAAAQGGPVDLIAGLAFPLPFQVIHEMLGMPDTVEADRLRSLSQTVTQVLDPVLAMLHTDEIFAAGEELGGIIADSVRWKRDHPGDDLLTALIEAEDDGTTLSDEELQDNITLLYLAGHETTVNLIGNGTLALLRHPDQAALLRDDPSLDTGAIEELLRYDSPVQFSRRIALEPFEVAGIEVGVGELVLTGLGAANRDPEKFGPTAEQLDITRPDANHHISFGSGVHHCLGAALARPGGPPDHPPRAAAVPRDRAGHRRAGVERPHGPARPGDPARHPRPRPAAAPPPPPELRHERRRLQSPPRLGDHVRSDHLAASRAPAPMAQAWTGSSPPKASLWSKSTGPTARPAAIKASPIRSTPTPQRVPPHQAGRREVPRPAPETSSRSECCAWRAPVPFGPGPRR